MNTLESDIGTDPCLADTDGDGVEDGYEYKSAIDLNDDEFQEPNTTLPYPGKRPYPNPLDPSDADKDFDGDVLTLAEEQALWRLDGLRSRSIGRPSATDSATDHDNDLLQTARAEIGTDRCLADTDRDQMTDGWEYYAAKDLNIKAVPYPGKRPSRTRSIRPTALRAAGSARSTSTATA